MGACSIMCNEIYCNKKDIDIGFVNAGNIFQRPLTGTEFATLIYIQLRVIRFLKNKKRGIAHPSNSLLQKTESKFNYSQSNQTSERKQKQLPQKTSDKKILPQGNNNSSSNTNNNNAQQTSTESKELGQYESLAQQVRKRHQDDALISQDPFKNKISSNRSHRDDPRSGPFDDKRRKYPKIQEDDFVYEGEWKNGKRDGLGILSMKEVSKYVGEFSDNTVSGFGVLYHLEGEKFVGIWIEFAANGPGYFVSQSRSFSQGYWENDLLQGFGIENWLKGQYSGDYNQGNKEGIGELIFEENSSYKGEFALSALSGIGTFIFSDNRKYEGEWKNNKMNGYGMITVGDQKSFYEGEFIDDRREGFGVFYSQRKIYIGMWRNSKLDGNTILVENGIIKKQYWENGKTIRNLPSNHKIFFEKYVNEIIDSQYDKIKKSGNERV